MLNKDEKDKDNKVKKKSIDDPDINKLDHRGLWQHLRHCLVERVHHQHCGDGYRDAGLKMLCLEIQSCLETFF